MFLGRAFGFKLTSRHDHHGLFFSLSTNIASISLVGWEKLSHALQREREGLNSQRAKREPKGQPSSPSSSALLCNIIASLLFAYCCAI